MMYEKPKHKPEHALIMALNFDEVDLEANREGLLSESQRIRLDDQQFKKDIILVGIIIWFVLVLAQVLFVQSADTWWFMAIFCGVVIVSMSHHRRRLYNDLNGCEGRVRLDIINERGLQYKIGIGDIELFVKKEVFLAFKNGDPYRIYYTPRTKKILSAEWLY